MTKETFIMLFGFLAGIIIGVYFFYFQPTPPKHIKETPHQVIGFLPYWLLDQAQTDYSNDITTLTYFGLNMDGNGHIVKLSTPQQEEPGWYALSSGKLKPFFKNARENNIKLSLLIASGNVQAIDQLISKPVQHANTLITDVTPLMKQYHFSNLNLDIEYSGNASTAAQERFTLFIKTVKQQLQKEKLGTLTVDITPNVVITHNLINSKNIAPYVDTFVLMAYDYHATVSSVTGPVAPLNGAGIDLEYDVTTAVEKTMQDAPAGKIVLGVPLYGYGWETLNTAVHSAAIPGTAIFASNKRSLALLSSCATCSAFFDNEAKEEYVVYKDQTTGTYHQIFFPTQQSMQAKINFAKKENLGGIGLWALGYEGPNILSPLSQYK